MLTWDNVDLEKPLAKPMEICYWPLKGNLVFSNFVWFYNLFRSIS